MPKSDKFDPDRPWFSKPTVKPAVSVQGVKPLLKRMQEADQFFPKSKNIQDIRQYYTDIDQDTRAGNRMLKRFANEYRRSKQGKKSPPGVY